MLRRPTNRDAIEAWTLPQLDSPPRLASPLSYMLDCLNDPDVSAARKDRLAIAAAPYCHAKMADKGKKAVEAEQAERAGEGGEWADDLAGDWQQ